MTKTHFACLICHTPLVPLDDNTLQCPTDELKYEKQEGIWRFLAPDRIEYFAKFAQEHQRLGPQQTIDHQALPYKAPTGQNAKNWALRALSYHNLIDNVLKPLKKQNSTPLKILDLGAGNGWLSNRLAQRGHQLWAVDVLSDETEGLGAYTKYEAGFIPTQAEFDSLPFVDSFFDLVIFNASLHYSESYLTTLSEAMRALKPKGQLIVMDSPLYKEKESGVKMLEDGQTQDEQRFGFLTKSLSSEHFLTTAWLDSLAEILFLEWRFIPAKSSLMMRLKPLLAQLRGQREPAQSPLIVGTIIENPEVKYLDLDTL